MIPLPRRWAAAAVLVTVGWLASPNAVPIYDGISQPDEPYRYVSAPSGYRSTPPVTSAQVSSPVKQGANSDGMSVQTGETGPQASVFIPPKAVAAASGPVVLAVVPKAPTAPPAGARFDGNAYQLTLTGGGGPVTLTPQAAIATLYLRATTAVQPGPVMEYRPDGSTPWKALKTSRGGQDVYVSSFAGSGEYALVFAGTKSASKLPYVLIGGFAVLVLLVIVIRVRAGRSSPE